MGSQFLTAPARRAARPDKRDGLHSPREAARDEA
jgi:hypothetical protein